MRDQKPISVLFINPHPYVEAGHRFRIQQFLPYLNQAGFVCTVRPFTSPQLFTLLHQPRAYAEKIALTVEATGRRLLDLLRASDYDLIYVHREAYPFFTPLAERLFRWRNPRLVFSFDDAIYAGHAETTALANKWLYRWKYGPAFNWVIRHSVHVVVGSRFLARYAERFNPRVSIVPTVVDTDRFRPRVTRNSVRIRIGWVGTHSTGPYLQPLLPFFQELTRRYKDRIEFHLYGDPRVPKFDPAVVVRDFCVATEVQDLQSFDIGIMPMPDNEWTRGKCMFKAIQYMAVGVPTVASPVGMVDELIEDGRTGLLACSPSDWVEKLSLLIEKEDLRRRIGGEGRRTVERNFSLRVWGPRFVQLLREIHESQAGRTSPASRL